MGSNLTLKNNLNNEFKIENTDNAKPITVTQEDLANSRMVNSIADLVALDDNNQRGKVYVKDYHTDAEGGGGLFIWDGNKPKSEHNGGTIINPTQLYPSDWSNQVQLSNWFSYDMLNEYGCWIRQYDSAVNIKWFGAKGDGITDDTKAFENSVSLGKECVVEKSISSYVISSTIQLINSLIGRSKPEIFISTDGSIGKRLFIVSEYLDDKYLKISGLKLISNYDGIGTAGEQSHAIRITSSRNVIVENCSITNFYGDCVYVGMNPAPTGLDWSENIIFENNYFDSPRRCHFAVVSGKNITFRNNELDRHTGYVAMIDIELNLDSRARIRDIYIENNSISNATDTSFFINYYNPNADVSDNINVVGNKGACHYFYRHSTGELDRLNIIDNEFFGSVGDARMLKTSAKNLLVRGNKDTATGSNGWSIDADNAIIENNYVVQDRAYGVSLKADWCIFKNNIIDGDFQSYGSLNIPEAVQFIDISNNIFKNADYVIDIEAVVTHGIISSNYISATRRAINITTGATGSDIHIDNTNNIVLGDVIGGDNLLRPYSTTTLNTFESITFGTSAPTVGTWKRGDIRYNTNPAAGGSIGWVCTADGIPGTWKTFGAITA